MYWNVFLFSSGETRSSTTHSAITGDHVQVTWWAENEYLC